MRNDFWDLVQLCNHSNLSPSYSESISCAHMYLGCSGGHEQRCLDCGVYMTEDPCGDMAGYSGWPYKRWVKKLDYYWSNKFRRGRIDTA